VRLDTQDCQGDWCVFEEGEDALLYPLDWESRLAPGRLNEVRPLPQTAGSMPAERRLRPLSPNLEFGQLVVKKDFPAHSFDCEQDEV